MTKNFQNSDVIWLDYVDSTNEEIKRRFQELTKPTWIIAKKQSKGKGRNGNSWSSGAGNFSGSIILFPTVERSYFHLYGFFVGVALYNTIKKFVKDGVDIRLKWPNDLMIENGKIAGILLESVQVPNSSRVGVIIGVGVNKTITVRKLSFGVGVERIFPVHAPIVDSIEVIRKGKVRRSKLYYLRERVGKSAKIKEDRN